MSTDTQKVRILKLLSNRGGRGALGYELNAISHRFGAHIHRLRKDGHNIYTERVKNNITKYILTEES